MLELLHTSMHAFHMPMHDAVQKCDMDMTEQQRVAEGVVEKALEGGGRHQRAAKAKKGFGRGQHKLGKRLRKGQRRVEIGGRGQQRLEKGKGKGGRGQQKSRKESKRE